MQMFFLQRLSFLSFVLLLYSQLAHILSVEFDAWELQHYPLDELWYAPIIEQTNTSWTQTPTQTEAQEEYSKTQIKTARF